MRVAALECAVNLKTNEFENKRQASLSGEQDSLSRGEIPPVGAQDIPLVRGVG